MSYAEGMALFQGMLASYAQLFAVVVVVLVAYGAIGLVVRSFVYALRGQ